MKKNVDTNRQLLLFLLVGSLNTLVGFGVYAFFVYLGIKYYLAVLFSTCVGILFSYFTMGKIVFCVLGNKNFIKFILLYVVLYFVNINFISVLNVLKIDLYLAGFISMFSLAIVSFFMNKYVVFKEY